jgi:UDP-N-acetylglucosamine 2-epimerase
MRGGIVPRPRRINPVDSPSLEAPPRPLRITTVIGNRPQFVKAAAVSGRLRELAHETTIHTGQHYDDELSAIFFEELGIPAPERQLGIGSGSNTDQTARMLAALGPELEHGRPELVLVYGDTNSTLAGALAGAQAGVPVAHVEAGMRSFDRTMPEELNRVLVDHAGDLLLCSTPVAVENLRRESVAGRTELVGDVMADIALSFAPLAAERSRALEDHNLAEGEYVLVTAHRAGNVDDSRRLERLVEVLEAIPFDALFPVHPRTRVRLAATPELWARLERAPRLRLVPPLGPLDFLRLLSCARALVTDSGGAQKEAYVLGVPCVTLRDRTEWVETVDAGWNTLADLDANAVLAALERPAPSGERPELYGGGRAGERVSDLLAAYTAAR